MVVLWLGLSLSSISKHNMWSYYGWFCRCCRPLVNIICGVIMNGFIVVVVCQYTQYVVVLWLGLLLLSSVSKHNTWSYYGWVCLRCHLSVNTILVVLFWCLSYVVVILQTQYAVVLWLGFSLLSSVKKTQYVVVLWRGLSVLSSASKHNMWSYYCWICRSRSSVNTICGRIMVGFSFVVVRQ